MPKVSVVIPTYNYAKYLAQALDSVLHQTYQDFEIIVVDDGSTDHTRNILSNYKQKLRCFYQKNSGVSVARNKGILESNGEYVTFLDADDYWAKDKLEKQMMFFKNNPNTEMIYTDMHCVDLNGKIVGSWLANKTFYNDQNVYKGLLRECFIMLSSVIIKKECFKKIGLFDARYRNAQDFDLWLNAAKECNISLIKEPLAFRRLTGNNMGGYEEEALSDLISILEDERTARVVSPEEYAAICTRLSEAYFYLGYFYFDKKAMILSRKNFINSMRLKFFRNMSTLYYLITFFPENLIQSLRKAKHILQKKYRYA